MQKNSRKYSNYIYALTMGTDKTILMATCIFYEFLLANKYPFDERGNADARTDGFFHSIH